MLAPTSTAADEGGTPMTRLLVVEPGYCPYQAGFSSAATAVSEVIEGESKILKPFGTPRIGLICSKAQSRLKYNRQVNDEGITVRGRFLICGLNGDKVVGLSKDQADRYSRLLFLPQVEDMASGELPAAKVRRSRCIKSAASLRADFWQTDLNALSVPIWIRDICITTS